MVILVGYIKPFKVRSENHMELFNEFSTLIVNYHLMCFTSFVPDPDTRELIGNSLVYCTGANLFINVMMVGLRSASFGCNRTSLNYVKCKKKRRQEKIRKINAKKKLRRDLAEMVRAEALVQSNLLMYDRAKAKRDLNPVVPQYQKTNFYHPSLPPFLNN
jgi:hypothetical protein